jgi:hypothetical protein
MAFLYFLGSYFVKQVTDIYSWILEADSLRSLWFREQVPQLRGTVPEMLADVGLGRDLYEAPDGYRGTYEEILAHEKKLIMSH